MLEKKLQENKRIVEAALTSSFADHARMKSSVADAMRYAALGGGKRIRAFLVRQFAALYGGSEEAAMQFAISIELGHAASLIHDDLPCMDDADLRHGKPSCHTKFGEEIAILAGDALLAMAFEVANENPYVSAEVTRYAVKTLAEKSGRCGMCLGQEMDLSSSCQNTEDLYTIYDLKTGVALQAAAVLGCLSCNRVFEEKEYLPVLSYTQKLGRIFQMTDDILDRTKTETETGKSNGIDERNGTKTILSFMPLHTAREEIEKLAKEASEIFEDTVLEELPFYLARREK